MGILLGILLGILSAGGGILWGYSLGILLGILSAGAILSGGDTLGILSTGVGILGGDTLVREGRFGEASITGLPGNLPVLGSSALSTLYVPYLILMITPSAIRFLILLNAPALFCPRPQPRLSR